jgi:hypothetical protein
MAVSGGAMAADADNAKMDAEVLQHFTKFIQTDTADPPGNEKPLANYIVGLLKAEGIPVQTFAVKG